MIKEELILRLENLLLELDQLIVKELGANPYKDLQSSLNIVTSRNLNQIASIKRKMTDLGRRLFDRNIYDGKVKENIDTIFIILKELE